MSKAQGSNTTLIIIIDNQEKMRNYILIIYHNIDKKIVDQIINVIIKTYCLKKKKVFIYHELKNLRNRL